MRLKFYDNTLRDGEQYPNLYFSEADKVGIAREMVDAGIEMMNAGFPAVKKNEIESISAVIKAVGNEKVTALSRCNNDDIDAVLLCGVTTVSLFYPGSITLRKSKKIFFDDSMIDNTVINAMKYAKSKNLKVIFGFEDMFRCDPDWIMERYAKYSPYADYLCLIDTTGIATPWTVPDYMKDLATLQIPIITHFHNDFGLATANTLAAVNSGATIVGTTVTGVGERAGNASFEEAVLALDYLMPEFRHSINLDKIIGLSEFVQSVTGLYLDPLRPIIGENAFRHESGVHIDSLVRDRNSYQVIDSTRLGKSIQFILGKHSGKNSIRNFLNNHNLPDNDDQVNAIYEEITKLVHENQKEIHKAICIKLGVGY